MSLIVDIRKQLGGFRLDVSFAADDPRETLALLGASGSGKSVALRCIAGIERPDEGRIALNGRVLFDSARGIDVPPQQRRVGYLFQNYALFPMMTVEQNVLAGVPMRTGQASSGADGADAESGLVPRAPHDLRARTGRPSGRGRRLTRAERRERAQAQIRAFRLEGLEGLRPAQLSGGQQQRCALARIMANEPELLLLDEPFSALDEYLRWQLELELADTLKAFPGGVVFVTHNRDEVYHLCQRVCVLTAGKSGRVMPTSELFGEPGTVAEARISGCKNLATAHPVGPKLLSCDDWGVDLACERSAEGCDHVGVRAHFLHIVGTGTQMGLDGRSGRDGEPKRACQNLIPCKVARVIDNVFSTVLMCETSGGALIRVELGTDEWAALGAPANVTLSVEPADVMPLRS